MIQWNESELGPWEESPVYTRRSNFSLTETDRGTGIKQLEDDEIIYDVSARYVIKNETQRNNFFRFYNVTLALGVNDFHYGNPLNGKTGLYTFLPTPPLAFTAMDSGKILFTTLHLRMTE